jgi:hypothetical protein
VGIGRVLRSEKIPASRKVRPAETFRRTTFLGLSLNQPDTPLSILNYQSEAHTVADFLRRTIPFCGTEPFHF